MFPSILVDADAASKFLDTISKQDNGRRLLSRLARTCKAFSEPTLNKLWQELDSFIPLIGLFPSALLRKTKKPGLGLAKPPQDGDWRKFLQYGQRVRRIAYNENYNNVAASIFSIFKEHRPQTWLLPNLRQLTWKVETQAGLERCTMFLSPGLEDLVLEVGGKVSHLGAFLADMCSRTRLKSFSFTSHANLPDNFTELLLTQKALERVVLSAPGALGPAVGRWCASLPALQSLQLDLTGRSPIAVEGFFDEIGARSGVSTPSSVGTTDSGVFSGEELDFSEIRKSALRLTGDLRSKESFAQLHHVHLTGEASNIAVFLRHLSNPLTRLTLVIEDPVDQADWAELSALLSERFGHSLQSLRITATGSSRFTELVRSTSRAEPPSRPLPLEYLAPLPHLIRFEVDLPESVIFHDSDVRHLAEVCPSLEVLKLCPVARFQWGPPSLSLGGIAALLSGCPRLHTLAVVVNAGRGNEELLESPIHSSRSLLRLHVGHSWVKDPLQVTMLLSHFAPHLETFKWHSERNRPGYVEANALGWESVNELLPHVSNVRLMERKRAVSLLAQPIRIRLPTSDKGVDATLKGVDRSVLARLQTREAGTQVTRAKNNRMIQAAQSLRSAAVDARPVHVDIEIDASSPTSHQSVDARPSSDSKSVDASIPTSPETSSAVPVNMPMIPSNYARLYIMSPLSFLLSLAFRFFVSFPLYIPLRLLELWLSLIQSTRSKLSKPSTPKETKEAETVPGLEKGPVVDAGSLTPSASTDTDDITSPVRA